MRRHFSLELGLALAVLLGSCPDCIAQDPPRLTWAKPSEVAKFEGHRGRIQVQFLPDSNHLVTADRDHVRLWEVGASKEVKKVKVAEEGQGMACMALSRDGKKAVVGGYQFLALLDLPSLAVVHRQDLKKGMHALDVRCVAFAPKDDVFLAGGLIDDRMLYDEKGNYIQGVDKSTKNVILVRDVATWKDQKRVPIGPDRCYRAAYLPDGRALVAFDEFEMTLVDMAKGTKIRKFRTIRQFESGGLAVSKDGSKFLFAQRGILSKGDKEGVLLLDVESGKKLQELYLTEFGVGGNVNNFDSVAISPDGKHACFVGRHKVDLTSKQYAVALIYDLAAWKEVARIDFPKTATFDAVTFSPDSQMLAIGNGVGVIMVFRAGEN